MNKQYWFCSLEANHKNSAMQLEWLAEMEYELRSLSKGLTKGCETLARRSGDGEGGWLEGTTLTGRNTSLYLV